MDCCISVINNSQSDNDIYGTLTSNHRDSLHEELYTLIPFNLACKSVGL